MNSLSSSSVCVKKTWLHRTYGCFLSPSHPTVHFAIVKSWLCTIISVTWFVAMSATGQPGSIRPFPKMNGFSSVEHQWTAAGVAVEVRTLQSFHPQKNFSGSKPLLLQVWGGGEVPKTISYFLFIYFILFFCKPRDSSGFVEQLHQSIPGPIRQIFWSAQWGPGSEWIKHCLQFTSFLIFVIKEPQWIWFIKRVHSLSERVREIQEALYWARKHRDCPPPPPPRMTGSAGLFLLMQCLTLMVCWLFNPQIKLNTYKIQTQITR